MHLAVKTQLIETFSKGEASIEKGAGKVERLEEREEQRARGEQQARDEQQAREAERAEETRLIRLAKDGNQAAMVELLQKVERSIYNTALYYMKNEHDARDIAQEAMIRIYTKLDTFKEQAQFKTWTQRITINLCKDKFRSMKEALSIEGTELEIEASSDLEHEITNKLVAEDLIELINALPETMRDVMIMRYVQEFSIMRSPRRLMYR